MFGVGVGIELIVMTILINEVCEFNNSKCRVQENPILTGVVNSQYSHAERGEVSSVSYQGGQLNSHPMIAKITADDKHNANSSNETMTDTKKAKKVGGIAIRAELEDELGGIDETLVDDLWF